MLPCDISSEHPLYVCYDLYLQVCYLVTSVVSTLIALVALGSSHWVELEEGVQVVPDNTQTDNYEDYVRINRGVRREGE